MKKKKKTNISKSNLSNPVTRGKQPEPEQETQTLTDPVIRGDSSELEVEYTDSEAPLEEGKPVKEIKGIKNVLIDKISPAKTLLINMELRNGMHRTFMIKTSKNSFKFMKGLYLIDTNLKYYKIDSKIWCLDYHQDLTIPVQRKIPIGDIKKAIENSGICEVESATNPALLQSFVKAEVSEGVMKGAPIDDVLKKITLLLAITAIASIAHLLIFMFKTGMLSSVKIPGM